MLVNSLGSNVTQSLDLLCACSILVGKSGCVCYIISCLFFAIKFRNNSRSEAPNHHFFWNQTLKLRFRYSGMWKVVPLGGDNFCFRLDLGGGGGGNSKIGFLSDNKASYALEGCNRARNKHFGNKFSRTFCIKGHTVSKEAPVWNIKSHLVNQLALAATDDDNPRENSR